MSASGFAAFRQRALRLDADVPATVNVSLAVAGTVTAVPIQAEAPMVRRPAARGLSGVWNGARQAWLWQIKVAASGFARKLLNVITSREFVTFAVPDLLP